MEKKEQRPISHTQALSVSTQKIGNSVYMCVNILQLETTVVRTVLVLTPLPFRGHMVVGLSLDGGFILGLRGGSKKLIMPVSVHMTILKLN